MSNLALRCLTGSRIFTGIATVLATNPTLTLFEWPRSPESTLPYRLFGGREAVLAGLIWTAKTPESLQQALLAIMLVDSIDAFCVCAAVLSGDLGLSGTAWAAGGIVLGFGIQLWALNDLRSQKVVKSQ
ncbi:hypothetical protein MMC07_001921 [Pseudocyphellaria aurata]|nr:hypothetical protein [Pseudocyphellaria aurata]